MRCAQRNGSAASPRSARPRSTIAPPRRKHANSTGTRRRARAPVTARHVPLIASHPTTRSICWHESGHATSLLLAGWRRWPSRRQPARAALVGRTVPDWERRAIDAPALRALLAAVLQGPLSDGQSVHFDHDWPLDAGTWEDNGADAEQIVFLVDLLGLRHTDYLHAVFRAVADGRRPEFRALQAAVCRRLEDVELLVRSELIEIAAAVIGET